MQLLACDGGYCVKSFDLHVPSKVTASSLESRVCWLRGHPGVTPAFHLHRQLLLLPASAQISLCEILIAGRSEHRAMHIDIRRSLAVAAVAN